MTRRWLPPLLLGVLLSVAAYQIALAAAPRFLMSAAIRRVAERGGFNAVAHAPLATDRARAIVRPSPDLAYSTCAFDLTPGPVEVIAPALPAPYWSLSVFDARTDVVFVRNNRDTAGRPIRLVIARPGQRVPAAAQAVTVNHARGIALIRALVPDRSVLGFIDRARRKASCRTLGS